MPITKPTVGQPGWNVAVDALIDWYNANESGWPTSAITNFVEAVQDAAAGLLVAGSNVSLNYDDVANTLTISATGGSGGLDAEGVRDVIGSALMGSGLVTVTADDAGDTITVSTTATANSPDATLLSRSNHTGSQPISTITDLQSALDDLASDPPPAGSVTDASVAADAAISLSKTVDSGSRLAMTSAERTKLTGVASGATANATDAQLRDRATHTGTQAASTVTGLAAVATSGSASDLASGTVPTARLGSGTANASTFHRGDQTWSDPSLLAPPVHAVGNSGTALTLDVSTAAGWVKTVTLTGNCTFTFTGASAGRVATLELVLVQDATGGRAVTWPASVKWSGGAPTLTTTAAAVNRLVFTSYDGGTTWYGDLIGAGYA